MDKKIILRKLLEEDASRVNNNINLSELSGKNILITGGTGLVGINIVNTLKYFNKHTAGDPIQISLTCKKKPTGYIADVLDDDNITTYITDLTQPGFSKNFPNADFILYCAGYGQPGMFLQDKMKTISLNTSALIEISSKLNPAGTILYLSTSEIYSGCASIRHSEAEVGTTGPMHPRACYIESKRVGETIIEILNEKGFRGLSARLALAYGPGTRPGDQRVLNQFISKALEGHISMLDTGSASRTYGYISDILIMLLSLLIYGRSGTYNVGGKSTTSIRELAQKISNITDATLTVPPFDNHMNGAPTSVELDLTKIESEFDLPEYIALDEGLKRTVQWIQNYE